MISNPSWTETDWRQYHEERAAIMEYDGHMNRDDADAAAARDLRPQYEAWKRTQGASDGYCTD